MPRTKNPIHKHGVYNKPSFGHVDEPEAVKDYTVLHKRLKSKRAKKILAHIIKQERHHDVEFGEIERLEKEERRKK